MIIDERIHQVLQLIVKVIAPRKIILFGSAARGEARADSDLDFIVLKDHVSDRRVETVRLLRELEPFEIPADIFIASEKFYSAWKDIPGTMLYEAAREGKLVYAAG